MKSKEELSVSAEYKPETTTPIVPFGQPFPNPEPIAPEKMDTETLTAFVKSNAKDLAVRSESLKPYYLELRSRIPQKEWDKLCKTLFGRTRRAIDYWLAGGNPVSKRKGHKPQYASPTPDGHNNMEARSALQKEVRRCLPDEKILKKLRKEIKACNEADDTIPDGILQLHEQNAAYWVEQLYFAGGNIWKKIYTMMHEDIGLADKGVWDEIRKVEQDAKILKDGVGGDLNAVHNALLLLCRSKKSRCADNIALFLRQNPTWRPRPVTEADIAAARKAAKVKREVPDYAKDMHTRDGKRRGRDVEFFLKEGTKLGNPATDVREVFSPDYTAGFADGVASVTKRPTKLEKPTKDPTKKMAA